MALGQLGQARLGGAPTAVHQAAAERRLTDHVARQAQRARTLTQILDDEPDLARMSVGLRTVRALVVNQ